MLDCMVFIHWIPLFPLEFVRLCCFSLGTLAGTDDFGHEAGQVSAHVRGILVNFNHVDRSHNGIVCKAIDPIAGTCVDWDSVEVAAKLGGTIALVLTNHGILEGLLLKPRNGPPSRKDRVFWERCGHIEWRPRYGYGVKYCWERLGLENYGIICDDKGVLKKKDMSTQSFLEDMYLV